MVVSIYGFPPVELVLFTLFGGTALAVSANVLNQIFEIETDKLMARTSDRPLVIGTISVKNAYIYSILLGLIGYMILYTQTTPLAAYIALIANIFYSFIYTLILKPRTNQNIVIGGAAGAAPVLIGWAATGTELDTGSWLLFLLVFLWTPAHFWALSIENVEDYRGAEFPMLPTQESKKRTSIFIGVYSCATVITSLLIAPVLQLGLIYLFLALIFATSKACFDISTAYIIEPDISLAIVIAIAPDPVPISIILGFLILFLFINSIHCSIKISVSGLGISTLELT